MVMLVSPSERPACASVDDDADRSGDGPWSGSLAGRARTGAGP